MMKNTTGKTGHGVWWPKTDRDRARATRGTFLLHLRPIKLSARTLRWTHTFGLGGTGLALWLTLASTGILMLLVYQPVPDVAYDSVRTLENNVRFGALVRGMHYWSANLLVAVVLLHIARVVLTGGYHRPRRLNWVIGTVLIAGVLASAFTGYLLSWDQRAFWAVTISTGMLLYLPGGAALRAVILGGPDVGADTLLAFYTFHTTVLPVLAIGLMAFHFWRVRKARGVIDPGSEADAEPAVGKETTQTLFFPDLLVREIAQALVVLAVVVLLGTLVGAPLGDRANPGMSPNPAKAPWYFMGFQELLIHLHPTFAVLVLPLMIAGAFLALPWLGDNTGPTGRWFLSPPARHAAGLAAVTAAVGTLAWVLLDHAILGISTEGPSWVLRGLVPTTLIAFAPAALALGLRAHFNLNRNESLQLVFVFITTVLVALTVTGVFFRGEGMALTLPWGGGG